MAAYTPNRGDLIWLEFDPQAGRERAGHRPALVLSPVSYNTKTGLALLCPITSRIKGYPFEVVLPDGFEIGGVVLSDQIRSLDWRVRKAVLIGQAPHATVQQVLAKVQSLLS